MTGRASLSIGRAAPDVEHPELPGDTAVRDRGPPVYGERQALDQCIRRRGVRANGCRALGVSPGNSRRFWQQQAEKTSLLEIRPEVCVNLGRTCRGRNEPLMFPIRDARASRPGLGAPSGSTTNPGRKRIRAHVVTERRGRTVAILTPPVWPAGMILMLSRHRIERQRR